MEESEKKSESSEMTENPISVEPTPAVEGAPEKGRAEPNEAFFGTLLLFCLALSLIAATGYFGFAGYRYFKQVQAEKAIPSIDALPKAEVAETAPETAPAATEDTEAKSETSAETAAIDKKTLVLKVLNGGAAKGVAGTYGEKLKAAGFTQTTVGNSIGDYAGQTLYHTKGQEAGADVIKTEVIKTYPKLVVKEAPAGNKDAAAAAYVLILGR